MRKRSAGDFEVFERAVAWFAELGVTIEAVLSDNAPGYLSRQWRDTCQSLEIEPRRIRPYTPRANGKVERFNRTLQEEWAYFRTYKSNSQRLAALARWLHLAQRVEPLGRACVGDGSRVVARDVAGGERGRGLDAFRRPRGTSDNTYGIAATSQPLN